MIAIASGRRRTAVQVDNQLAVPPQERSFSPHSALARSERHPRFARDIDVGPGSSIPREAGSGRLSRIANALAEDGRCEHFGA